MNIINTINFKSLAIIIAVFLGVYFLGTPSVYGQNSESLNKEKWKGFEKIGFEFEGTTARLVKPTHALEGNPWVWRARFPNWHVEMDSILLSKGFHIAYINTNHRFGSPKAMRIWDKFYEHLTSVYGLSEKLALEGVSRGGLFVYNWAKNNPEKVNCIYAEAPVCDFKSWPLGAGEGKGWPEGWPKLKKEYGFSTDEEAKKYKNNPIDGLERLAEFQVPILHMVSLEDKVVPYHENSEKLINAYINLGGIATVVPCTQNMKTEGHHFDINTPERGAAFIIQHTEIAKAKLKPEDYHELRIGLKNSQIKFTREKKGTVAFLGGSITYNSGWRNMVCNYLEEKFPETEFTFVAAGIPSMGTTSGAFRIERDVFSKGEVDLLFEEAAVNDRSPALGRSSIDRVRGMEGIIRHARKVNPAMDIVVMHFVDPNKMKDYNNGKIPEEIANHESIATHYNVASINLAKEVTDRINAGEFTWEDDFKNLHPSPFGQKVYAHSITTLLDHGYYSFVADDDQITTYDIPEMKDPYSYDKGRLISIDQAKINKGWIIDPSWTPEDKVRTRPGYTKIPMLIGSGAEKYIKLDFVGRAIGIAVVAGPDAGIIEYSIDGGKFKQHDLYTPVSKRLHLPRYFMLDPMLNPEKKHTIKIRMSKNANEQSKGNVCRIYSFFVN